MGGIGTRPPGSESWYQLYAQCKGASRCRLSRIPAIEDSKPPPRWEDLPNPILVVEILSPSTARYDRQVKRRWFQHAGIAEFWIVDPDAGVIERWRPADSRPEVLDQSLAWQRQPDITPLLVDLPTLFAEALGPT